MASATNPANMAWTVADPWVSAWGTNTCRIFTVDGAPVVIQTTEPTRTPWGPSAFDKSVEVTRLSLDVRATPELLALFEQIDAWVIDYATASSERILGKAKSREEVIAAYHSCARRSEKYPATLRTKVNATGACQMRCWDDHGAPQEEPADWRGVSFNLRAHLSHLWLMGKEFGAVVLTTDVSLLPEHTSTERECPVGV